MGKSKIKFGDKLFLYGKYLQLLPDYENPEYNILLDDAQIYGFVVDFLLTSSLAVKTPFSELEMVDVTDKLARHLPLPEGSTVWTPTTQSPEVYFSQTQT